MEGHGPSIFFVFRTVGRWSYGVHLIEKLPSCSYSLITLVLKRMSERASFVGCL
jgi:hypothetical protein